MQEEKVVRIEFVSLPGRLKKMSDGLAKAHRLQCTDTVYAPHWLEG